jgi:GTP cyclohydrolase I
MEAVTDLTARLPAGAPTVPAGAEPADREATIADLTRRLLEEIGENPFREGLIQTPERVARAWGALTSGYALDLTEVANGALFPAEGPQMVVVRDIEFHSLCEHHLLPFFGRAHIGYRPASTVLGLSKFARITDMFARRLQVQERLTAQIASALMGLLDAAGVGVVVEAEHLCMAMRGVQRSGALTTTSCLLGTFREDPATRQEFLDVVGISGRAAPPR